MPIEVNELGIFMKIMGAEKGSQRPGNNQQVTGAPAADKKGSAANNLVEECVTKILEILESKNRR